MKYIKITSQEELINILNSDKKLYRDGDRKDSYVSQCKETVLGFSDEEMSQYFISTSLFYEETIFDQALKYINSL